MEDFNNLRWISDSVLAIFYLWFVREKWVLRFLLPKHSLWCVCVCYVLWWKGLSWYSPWLFSRDSMPFLLTIELWHKRIVLSTTTNEICVINVQQKQLLGSDHDKTFNLRPQCKRIKNILPSKEWNYIEWSCFARSHQSLSILQ